MKLAVTLDGVLADIDTQLSIWREHLSVTGYPFTTKAFLNDESFWATMKPFGDTIEFAQSLGEMNIPYIILTERPKRLRYLTGNWLGRHGFDRTKVIYGTIKRFDCHVNNADYIIDCNFPDADWYRFEVAQPITLDRKTGRGLMEIMRDLNADSY